MYEFSYGLCMAFMMYFGPLLLEFKFLPLSFTRSLS